MGSKEYDVFFRKPGTVKEVICSTCGEVCYASRGVEVGLSPAECAENRRTIFDIFFCFNLSYDWHKKAVEMVKDIEKEDNISIKKKMQEDLKRIIDDK